MASGKKRGASAGMIRDPNEFVQTPLFGVTITIIAYVVSLFLHRKWTWMNPLFFTSGGLIVFLLTAGISYEDYRIGGDFIVFFLGPATVALGVPLYKQAQKIKQSFIPIVTGMTLGSISSLVIAGCLAWLLGGTESLMLSMLPKSVTSPVALEIVRQLGGIPELGAVLAVLTGLLGSMLGPELLRLFGVRSDIPIGAAIGTAAHGIGMARVLQESEVQGSVGGFCMGLNAIVTSIFVIPLYWWFG
jgi:predicted murein hydrolase (TIGR00659 family)